ncbi:MAG: dTDP-4-dehydrorhamnose 3,5-epimerase [Myxococcales bacterium]
MIETRTLGIEGLVELRPKRWRDERGFFSEVWRDEWLGNVGVDLRFVQDNHSYSNRRGVLRGLHFQAPPMAQDKLVRVARGSIFDVAVDIRSGSATYGQWAGIVISADDWNQLWIPRGFAHGFVTLEDDTDVLYKVTAPYSPEYERTIRFDDPALGIDWPLERTEILLSPKDQSAPLLSGVETGF